ncbi:HAD family hydrolase [Paenibacillus sp. L3-i20]|uniref:HAD family hydrolase n=1 Tax=Paenibacillus sp. L3-i20 TaxID=2905833 RepID=UPI001EDF6133|nr:HAD-IA family hydrolase [Paenibacillus sp. L3-i20]GKU78716.1 hypothetical protein L3i20_v231130 [Paenibacillus sp. L3-i20]
MLNGNNHGKLQLVLDIGGVLATNISPVFWDKVADHAQLSKETLYGSYKEQISKKLWRGHFTEVQFWEWLILQSGTITIEKGQSFLAESLLPLPAIDCIPRWSHYADIHILSNHIPSWVEPILSPIRPYLGFVIISSDIGLSKPEREAFNYVTNLLPNQSNILFVDDQIKNVMQAESIGWRTLIADPEGKWIEQIEKLIKC